MELERPEGATPIEEVSDLIPAHLSTRDELNEWESANILKAVRRHLIRRRAAVTEAWLKRVHRDMFNDTWKWAGEYRKTGLSIGVPWHQIPEQMKLLVDDLAAWEKDGEMPVFEQSVRMHHRISRIHPFRNGNGRHARLAADIFLYSRREKMPDWPDEDLVQATGVRKDYIGCLRAADQGEYGPLIRFIQSLVPKPQRPR